MWPFHKHYWKYITGNVSSKYNGFAAFATLECEYCGKRKFFERGGNVMSDQFPSEDAARVWVESLLPKGHSGLAISDSDTKII